MYLEDFYDLEAERNPNPGRYIPAPATMTDEEFIRYAQDMDERQQEHRDTIDSAIAATLQPERSLLRAERRRRP